MGDLVSWVWGMDVADGVDKVDGTDGMEEGNEVDGMV